MKARLNLFCAMGRLGLCDTGMPFPQTPLASRHRTNSEMQNAIFGLFASQSLGFSCGFCLGQVARDQARARFTKTAGDSKNVLRPMHQVLRDDHQSLNFARFERLKSRAEVMRYRRHQSATGSALSGFSLVFALPPRL